MYILVRPHLYIEPVPRVTEVMQMNLCDKRVFVFYGEVFWQPVASRCEMPDGTSPLSKPISTFHQWAPVAITWAIQQDILQSSITKITWAITSLKFKTNILGTNDLKRVWITKVDVCVLASRVMKYPILAIQLHMYLRNPYLPQRLPSYCPICHPHFYTTKPVSDGYIHQCRTILHRV